MPATSKLRTKLRAPRLSALAVKMVPKPHFYFKYFKIDVFLAKYNPYTQDTRIMESMPFHELSDQDFLELFPKNYDLAYDEDGEWVYYNGEWFPSDAYDLE